MICSSDDLYTDEDIQIMAGEKSPTRAPKSPEHETSTSSVAQFFAQACQHEQKQQQPEGVTSKPEPAVNVAAQHPPGAVVSGGPPGIRHPIPTTAPIQGKIQILLLTMWVYGRKDDNMQSYYARNTSKINP